MTYLSKGFWLVLQAIRSPAKWEVIVLIGFTESTNSALTDKD